LEILRDLTKMQWLGVTLIATSIGLYACSHSNDNIYPKTALVEAHTVSIESHIDGVIKDVSVQENHLVSLGDQVADMEKGSFASKVRETQIQGLGAKAKINYADADIALLETRVQSINKEHEVVLSMLEQAKIERESAEARFASGAIDKDALYDYTRAQQSLEREVVSLSNQTAEIIAEQEKVEMSKGEAYAQGLLMMAKMNTLALETQKLSIPTPVNGVVSSVHVSSGQYVREGDAIADIIDLSDIWVTAYVDESDIEHVAVGSLASVKVNYKDQWMPAVVKSVSPVAQKKRVGWLPFKRSVVPVRLAVKLNDYIQPGVEVDVIIIPSQRAPVEKAVKISAENQAL
jgi:multidrug resistance efflux pump